ncbi:hypothetical protein MTO96_009594 [Rhipicephalus appendiculatus]
MATSTYSKHDLVQCPYDPNHKVKRSRIDIHISKCRRQVGRPCLRPCLFNPNHLAPSKMSQFLRHLETCPDKSSTLWVPRSREDLEIQYVVPAAGSSRPKFPDPEEIWEEEPTTTPKAREPPVPPVFREVHGLSYAERRAYYRSLFENQVDYAPPKQEKNKAGSSSSNQSTYTLHAEASMPRGVQAASPVTVINEVNWPSCDQACQVHTGHAPTRKSWAQVAAQPTDRRPHSTPVTHTCSTKANQVCSAQVSQPRNTQASQKCGTQGSRSRDTQASQPRGAQAGHPRAVPAAQCSQASQAPVRTWADLFRSTTATPRNTDLDEK